MNLAKDSKIAAMWGGEDRKMKSMAADLDMRDGTIEVLKKKLERCQNVERERNVLEGDNLDLPYLSSFRKTLGKFWPDK